MSFRASRDAKDRRRSPLRLTFERHDWQFEGEAGDRLEGRGFTLRDGGRSLSWTSPALAEAGVEVVKVAGTTYRLDELQDPGYAPGLALALRPEPDNPYDPNAIGVWNEAETAQAGYVPREQAAALIRRLQSEELDVLSLWEWRDVGRRRCGLRIFIAPAQAVSESPLARREAGPNEAQLGPS